MKSVPRRNAYGLTIIGMFVIMIMGCSHAPPPEGFKANIVFNDVNASAGIVTDKSPPSLSITSPKITRSTKLIEKGATISINGTVRSNSGVAKVTINGQEAGLGENGVFWGEVLLKVGENQITVTATGINRKQKSEKITVVREAEVKVASPVASVAASTVALVSDVGTVKSQLFSDSGKYYALIIGINSYRYIDRLQTATNDAKTVAQILNANYGFESKLILDQDATRESVMNELNSLRLKLQPNDNLLIYYAGHGVHDKVTDASYWLPVDAKLDNDTNWIDAKNITDQLKRISAKHVLIVADSCYSGTISRSIEIKLKSSDNRENYLRKIQGKNARVLISSGGNEPVADSGGKEHSIFSQVFIDTLLKPGQEVFTAEEMHVTNIKESVAGQAEQTPEYKVIRNSGHDGGDFVFVKKY